MGGCIETRQYKDGVKKAVLELAAGERKIKVIHRSPQKACGELHPDSDRVYARPSGDGGACPHPYG